MKSLNKNIIKNILTGNLSSLRTDLKYLPIEDETSNIIDNLFGELTKFTLHSLKPKKTLEIIMDR